VGGAF